LEKQTDREEKIVDNVMRLWQQVSGGTRSLWESHWQEIAERMIPGFSGTFLTNTRTPGEKKQEFVFDSTASIALNRFGAILDSLLTPANQKWHRIKTDDEVLNKNRQVQMYYEDIQRILFKQRYSPQSNFTAQNQMNFKGLGAFGTSCMFTDGHQIGRGLRYKSCHIGSIFPLENHQGIVDTVLRYFTMEARQMAQRWGKDNLPEGVKVALEKDPTRDFYVIHCVMPREEYDMNSVAPKDMPFASYYIAFDGKKLMEESGFNSMPYSVSRYEQYPGETLGRSPAMEVLPSSKTLNEMKKTMLKQGHRTVDPVLLAHDDGIIDTFSLKPGSINGGGISKEGRALIQPLPVGSLSAGKDMMDEERSIINDSFLVTIFQILVDTPQMTATEVLERTREKGILLAPTLGRQQSEYLGPTIERELDILAQQGLLPEMPRILQEAGGEYRVEYDSPMSRTQRAEEATGLARTLEMTLNAVNVTGNPAPLDHFNWDVIIPELSDINAIPERWMRSQQEIAEIRQGRAEQAQRQEEIQSAPGAAQVMKAIQ